MNIHISSSVNICSWLSPSLLLFFWRLSDFSIFCLILYISFNWFGESWKYFSSFRSHSFISLLKSCFFTSKFLSFKNLSLFIIFWTDKLSLSFTICFSFFPNLFVCIVKYDFITIFHHFQIHRPDITANILTTLGTQGRKLLKNIILAIYHIQ